MNTAVSHLPNIKGKMECITPKDAAEILESRNGSNRPLRPRIIDLYAKEIVEGRWNSGVADAICFTSAGELLNGQHRLHALVKANKPVWFFVARDVPKSAFQYMDIGARRSISDRTRIERKSADIVTSMIRVLGGGAGAAGDPDEVSRIYSLFSEEVETFTARKISAGRGATASLRVALIMLVVADEYDKDELVNQLTAFTQSNYDGMTDAVAGLHGRLNTNNRRKRISSLEREDVFAESIRAFGDREEDKTKRVSQIISEYRLKFSELVK